MRYLVYFLLINCLPLSAQISLELDWTTLEENVEGGLSFQMPKSLTNEQGEVCVCATTSFFNGFDHAFYLVKYDSLGNKLWDTHYNTGYTIEDAEDCEIDSEGNVVIGGGQTNGFEAYPWTIVKYNPDGELLWFYKKEPIYSNSFGDIEVDHENNIYVLNSFREETTDNDYLSMIKLDKDGNQVWQYDFKDGDFNHHPIKAHILEDKIMLFGIAGGYKIIQLDFDGNLIDVAGFGGVDLGDAIFDSKGNLLIGDEAKEYEVTKISPNGDILWVYELPSMNEPFSSFARLRDLRVDKDNNVYLAGEHYTDTTLFDIVTTKLNPDGEILWANRYTLKNNTSEIPYDIQIDNNYVYVTGTVLTGDTTNATDLVFLVYSLDGEIIDSTIFDNFNSDIGTSISILVTFKK